LFFSGLFFFSPSFNFQLEFTLIDFVFLVQDFEYQKLLHLFVQFFVMICFWFS